MQEWLPFLGRLHPVVVHAPIGFVLVLALLALISPRGKRPGFHNVERIVLWALAVASVLAVSAGLALAQDGAYGGGLFETHRNFGIAMVIGALFAVALHYNPKRWPYLLALTLTVALTGAAGHYGGSITHGRGHLTNALPERWQAYLAGEQEAPAEDEDEVVPDEEADPEEDPGVVPAAAEGARLYADLVQPILEARCYSCHGPDADDGGLRLHTHEAIMTGGDTGSIVAAGQPHESELIRRLNLPADHPDRMPPEGRSPLPPEEVAVLQWWVAAGAPEDGAVADYLDQAPQSAAEYAGERIGAEDAPAVAALDPGQPDEDEIADIHARAFELAGELEIIIHPIAQDEPGLRVVASQAGASFGDEELERLRPIQRHIHQLDLTGTGVTDQALEQVGEMAALQRLNLARTSISGEDLSPLLRLSRLRYLNLYGTDVGDDSLGVFALIPDLEQLYLWETNVSPEAADALAEQAAARAEPRIRELRFRITELERELDRQGLQVLRGATLAPVNGDEEAEEPDAPENGDAEETGDPDPEEETIAQEAPGDPEAPINTVCLIADAPVDPAFTVEHDGHVIGFCCGNCQAQFEEDPEAFADALEELVASAQADDGEEAG